MPVSKHIPERGQKRMSEKIGILAPAEQYVYRKKWTITPTPAECYVYRKRLKTTRTPAKCYVYRKWRIQPPPPQRSAMSIEKD